MKKVQIDLSSLRSVGRVLVNSHSEGLFISASHQNIRYKQSKIAIKEISITEHDNEPNIMPYGNIIKSANLANNKEAKVDFEECIFYLSKELQDELRKMDTYLLSEKSLKIKRRIEGDHHGCKITYTSQTGFSYSLLISDELLNHFFWWYMLSNYKFENKYGGRKNDLTNET